MFYYAGAVSIMFILFSAMNGALGLIEDRNSGLFDRYLSFGRGVGFALRGRALFLTGLGVLQMVVVFAVAWAVCGVTWPEAGLQWLVAALLSAASVAGLALLCASACKTRAQMQTLSTFTVLVLSALGGSMVPLYLMPDWLRWVGELTSSAWSIALFDGLVSRDLTLGALWRPAALLALTAILSFSAAVALTKRRVLM